MFCSLAFSSIITLAGEKSETQNARPLDVKGVKRLIHERHGKILFLNLWATWCAPCVEEFPDIVKFSHIYTDSLVEVVAISVDYPDEADSKVRPFLKKHNVDFKVYIADAKDQEDFINAVNSSWSGAVPATFIFGKHGKQRAFLLGKQNLERFKNEIEKIR
ncbi:MAG: TlpA family protein disulfide reductase [Bacteroidota bacterium]|nr:TlpA family protein disulfide reductase [Bacteroidota bacterium]